MLNCANGTLNLRTGRLQAHDRADLITRQCPVRYDDAATAPTFHRFLEQVQPDPEVRRYLARVFGYAAVGLSTEHVLVVLWGAGANGKSVLVDAVTHVLDGYAKPVPPSLVVSAKGCEPHPTDIASCIGARLVVVHETRRGADFDASKVKLLTGGDRLTARFMRQDFLTFKPSHTLVMLSNFRPRADAGDAALWRRISLVPFEVVIDEDKRDARLGEKLRAEAPGILRWVVEGAQEWQQVGLSPPASVREQTARYRASEDVVGSFLAERTVTLPRARVGLGLLYDAYREWCEATGQRIDAKKEVFDQVQARGFERRRFGAGIAFLGLGLRHEADYPLDDP